MHSDHAKHATTTVVLSPPASGPRDSPSADLSTAPSSAIARPSGSLMDMITDIGNMLKAFIGINFISVAYAFSNAGIIRGLVGLVVIVVITEHCCSLLIEIKQSMHTPLPPNVADEDPFALDDEDDDDDDDDGLDADGPERRALRQRRREAEAAAVAAQNSPSVGDIARHVGGPHAQTIMDGSILLTQFGFCVGYLIFLSQTVHDLVGSAGPVSPFVLLPLPILAYIAMLRSIRSLGPFSLVANFALLAGFVCVVAFIAKHFNWTPSHVPLTSFPLFFGQITAAIEGIGLIIPVQTSMHNPEKFPIVLRIALGTITAILATVGVLGFATFGADTRSIILLNFGASPVVVLVKLVLVVGILFTYPLQIIPVFEFAERKFCAATPPPAPAQASGDAAARRARANGAKTGARGADGGEGDDPEAMAGDTSDGEAGDAGRARGDAGPPAAAGEGADEGTYIRNKRVLALRLAVIVMTAVTAVLGGASFGIFNALVGSVGATMLAYTGPALLHYMRFRERLSTAAKVKNIAIVIFGLVGAIVGTAASLYEIVQIHKGASTPT